MNSIIVRSRRNVFRHETELLASEYGFQEINDGETSKGIKTPKELALFFLGNVFFVLKNIKNLNRKHTIIAVGYPALVIKLLIKLGLVKCKQLLWFGFFIHTDLAFKIFRVLLNLLSIKNEKIVLNAWYEIPLYAKRLNIEEHKLTCLPLGDWKPNELFDPAYQPPFKDYHFAGGFTNRDYASLIEVFKNTNKNLIIVGSKLNSDLNVTSLPENILILKDIDKVEFESLVGNSSVCILPMKDRDAGASGHMVLLAYMRHKKPILASNYPAIQEYLTDQVSGLLYDDPLKDLPTILEEIDQNKYGLTALGENALLSYNEKFTREALANRLTEIIDESSINAKNKLKSTGINA
ncbi:MAG: glycosyltransferase [Cyclobacteriaceae bacterium]